MTPINDIELKILGLQRSGNHAIIHWIIGQFSGQPYVFLNNIKHGPHDPYHTCAQAECSWTSDCKAPHKYRQRPKKLLIYSYEDDPAKMSSDDFLGSALTPDFESTRHLYLGSSKHYKTVFIIRDPFNYLASRLKHLQIKNKPYTKDMINQFSNNWKQLAKKCVEVESFGEHDALVIKYNEWNDNIEYRKHLSKVIGGSFNDKPKTYVPGYGGGSSFDETTFSPIDFAILRKKWKRFFHIDTYKRIPKYLSRLNTPGAQAMKVNERWKLMRNDPTFRSFFLDRELTKLSATLFGEIPGTTTFLSAL